MENPGKSLQEIVSIYLNKVFKYKNIHNETELKLDFSHYLDPRGKGLMKIHKTVYRVRLIVGGIDGPMYKLSKFFNKTLDNFRSNNVHDVNVLELKEKLDVNQCLTHDYKLISFDVKSLITNVPIKMVLDVINQNWTTVESRSSIKSKQLYLEDLIKCCILRMIILNMTLNIMSKIFLSMGVSLSVNVTGILMNHILGKVIENTRIKPSVLIK